MITAEAQAERLFGYGRDELTGDQVEILVPDASRQRRFTASFGLTLR